VAAVDSTDAPDQSASVDVLSGDTWTPPDAWDPTDTWNPGDVYTPDNWIGQDTSPIFDATDSWSSGDAGVGSCLGKCGVYVSADSCHCDNQCASFKDCCADYNYLCSGDVSVVDSISWDIGSSDAGSWDTGYNPDITSWDAGSDAGGTGIVACADTCATGQMCNYTYGFCYTPCLGSCVGDGVACEPAPDGSGPGTCVGFYAANSWGLNTPSGGVQRISKLSVAPKGVGCDLNGDGQADNSLSGAASLVGSSLQTSVDSGAVVVLFDPASYGLNLSPFYFSVLSGSPNPAYPTCKPGAADCHFLVSKFNYNLSGCAAGYCDPQSQASGSISSGSMYATAGQVTFPGDGSINSLFLGGAIDDVTLTGVVSDGMSWKTTTSGLLCGYVTAENFNIAIDKLPTNTLAQFGGADAIKKLMPSLMKLDIDTNGDNIYDAFSVAYQFETNHAIIDGFAP
jgi:hypothetical protein